MTEDLKCPECGAKGLLYREVRKETSLVIRVVSIIGALYFSGSGIKMALDTGGFFPLVPILIGIFLLWASLSGRMKDLLTSVRFKCGECSHEWNVEIQGMSYARKWQEIPAAEWRKVVSGRKIPGLGK